MRLSHLFNEGSNWHTDPEQQSMDATRRARLGREREPAGSDTIDARLAANNNARQQYAETGRFWLKQKDTQQHLNDQPYTGKAAANAAALELLKQQPELRGNLVITAYGPGEQQVTEGRVKELGQDLKDKAMSDDDFKKKYSKTRAEVRAAMREKPVAESSEQPIKKSDWFNPTDSRSPEKQKAAYLNHLAAKKKNKNIQEQGVAEGLSDIVKGVKRKVAGKADPKEVEHMYGRIARSAIKHKTPDQAEKDIERYKKVSKVVNKEDVAEGSEEGFSIEDMVMDQYRNGNEVWEIASNMGMSEDEVQDIINDSEQGVTEGSDERSQNRLWQMITDYEQRAKATKNDIKKDHYLKMASELRGKLKTSDEQGVAEGSAEAPLKHHTATVSYHKKDDPHRRYEARFKTTHNLGKEETEKRAKAAFAAKGKVVYNIVHEQGVAEAPGAETLGHNQSTVASNLNSLDLGEGSDDTVGFSVNSEAAYQAVMARFGDHVDHDETSGIMYVPTRMWPQVEMVAFDADGEGAVQADGLDEGEKVGNMDADRFDAAMARLKKLAGAGPMKTVYDPTKRVYKNVPTAQQPGDKK